MPLFILGQKINKYIFLYGIFSTDVFYIAIILRLFLTLIFTNVFGVCIRRVQIHFEVT